MGVYIIAEAGVNHNGNLGLALELVEKASEIGADCVKFQTFNADNLVTLTAPKAKYQLEVTDNNESQFEMLKKLELKKSDYLKIIEKCKQLRIDFLSTPYNEEDVDFLEELNVNAYKIASGQLTELPFLNYVARKNKKIILSTGMGDLADVFRAVQEIKSTGNNDIIVLQCTTNYPSKIEDSNVRCMKSIAIGCNVKVGYSDHVVNNYACFAAVALGAEVIEKHFTLDKNLEGPDHSCSLEPNGFADLIFGIRQIEKSLGNGIKIPSENEIRNSYGMKRSIVANIDIPEGVVITKEMLGFKRPFNGLSPNLINEITGKTTCTLILKDQAILNSMINW